MGAIGNWIEVTQSGFHVEGKLLSVAEYSREGVVTLTIEAADRTTRSVNVRLTKTVALTHYREIEVASLQSPS